MHDDKAGVPANTADATSHSADAAPAARSPLARNALGTSFAGALLIYLFLLFVSIPRHGYGYTYIHFLFDYHFGPTRRALEGEIARHLFPPPYWIGNFRDFSHWMLALAMVLFVAIAAVLGRRRRTAGGLLLLLVIVTSPLTFKQMIADEGRQDIFGVIVMEITFLLTFLRSPAPAVCFLSIVLLPLTLVNENHLLLSLPSCVTMVLVKVWATREQRRWWWLVLPVAAFAMGFAINLLLPPPRVPYERYEAYLASKSLYPLGSGTPDRWLYTGVRENLGFAAREWHRLGREHWRHAADYLMFLSITGLVAALVWTAATRVSRKLARNYLLVVGFIAAFYVVLCAVASDEARWLANFGTYVLFVSLFWCDTFEIHPAKRYALAFVAMFQLMLHAGFGITVADLDLAGRLKNLVAYYDGNSLKPKADAVQDPRPPHVGKTAP